MTMAVSGEVSTDRELGSCAGKQEKKKQPRKHLIILLLTYTDPSSTPDIQLAIPCLTRILRHEITFHHELTRSHAVELLHRG